MSTSPFTDDKILRHPNRIAEWMDYGTCPPITMELDLTNRCNLNCPHCAGFAGGRDHSEWDMKELRDIIHQLSEFGVRAITLTGGGEPLVHPHFETVVDTIFAYGMEVSVITNGTLVTRNIADIIKEKCTWCRISLDAGDRNEYKQMHGVDKWDDCLQGISLLAEAEGDCTIGVGYLTGESNPTMESATAVAKACGADYIQFRPLHGVVNQDVYRHWDECKKHEDSSFQVLASSHKYDCMARNDLGRNYGRCYGHHFAGVIAANKKMYVCCHMRGVEKYCIGDLSEHTLREVWYSRQRKQVADSIDFKDCPPLCRCNTFNQILWNITQEKTHENFL